MLICFYVLSIICCASIFLDTLTSDKLRYEMGLYDKKEYFFFIVLSFVPIANLCIVYIFVHTIMNRR